MTIRRSGGKFQVFKCSSVQGDGDEPGEGDEIGGKIKKSYPPKMGRIFIRPANNGRHMKVILWRV